ncbi:MAG: hypothetical protein JO150_06915 [Acidobacteriaceae bacterium]|nr:hypothetical protein [Acidobacteriaceae bacterium]
MRPEVEIAIRNQKYAEALKRMPERSCDVCGQQLHYRLCVSCDLAFEYGHSDTCGKKDRNHESHRIVYERD